MSGSCRDYITEVQEATIIISLSFYSSEEFSCLNLDAERVKAFLFF